MEFLLYFMASVVFAGVLVFRGVAHRAARLLHEEDVEINRINRSERGEVDCAG